RTRSRPEAAAALAAPLARKWCLLGDLEVLVHLGLVHRAVEPPAARLERHHDGLRAGESCAGDVLLELRLRRLLPLEHGVVEAGLVADGDAVGACFQRGDLLAAPGQR